MVSPELQRDKHVTQAIHSLFWQAIWQNKGMVGLVYLGHVPAFFVYNILIPLQVAYSIQSIITRHFNDVGHQAMILLIVTLLSTLVFTAGPCDNGSPIIAAN